MNKPTSIALTAVAAGVVVVSVLQWQNFVLEVQKRHPEMDSKSIGHAYRIFLKELATGQIHNDSNLSTKDLEMLLSEFRRMRNPN